MPRTGKPLYAAGRCCTTKCELPAVESAEDCGSILVVDDDERFLAFLAVALERAGYPTVTAARGEDALPLARARRPGLALVDINLPGITGYELCRELKESLGPEFPVFLISGHRTETLDRVGGLLIGADDYLVKPVDPGELIARVRRFVSPPRASPEAAEDPRVAALTPREREILGLLVEGLDQAEIARRLFLSPTTVGTHIQRVLGKLGVHNRTQAVALAVRLGLSPERAPPVPRAGSARSASGA